VSGISPTPTFPLGPTKLQSLQRPHFNVIILCNVPQIRQCWIGIGSLPKQTSHRSDPFGCGTTSIESVHGPEVLRKFFFQCLAAASIPPRRSHYPTAALDDCTSLQARPSRYPGRASVPPRVASNSTHIPYRKKLHSGQSIRSFGSTRQRV
jgi:hypothetical protein